MERPYHKYVFNAPEREFVGKFEEMYQQEEVEGYDSWFQENLNTISRGISLAMLGMFNFDRILDIGCGKVAFTHMLKKSNNYVMGTDISKAAIDKANAKYPDIDFRQMPTDDLSSLADESFDLVVSAEILSYLKNWREVLQTVSTFTRYLFLTLYIPENPIGFVESFDELTGEVSKHFVVERELMLDREKIFLLSRSRETLK